MLSSVKQLEVFEMKHLDSFWGGNQTFRSHLGAAGDAQTNPVQLYNGAARRSPKVVQDVNTAGNNWGSLHIWRARKLGERGYRRPPLSLTQRETQAQGADQDQVQCGGGADWDGGLHTSGVYRPGRKRGTRPVFTW